MRLDETSELIAHNVVEFLTEDLGYDTPEEAIPGLVRAILVFAAMTPDPQDTVDEAVDALSDYTWESDSDGWENE